MQLPLTTARKDRFTLGRWIEGGAMLRLLLLAAVALAVAGCMTGGSGCGDVAGIERLQCLSRSGDKHAQLALGRAYEDGDGVAQDYRRAAKLYRAAAAPVSGTIYVYSPPVGRSPAQVLPLRSGPDQPGLAEAASRLARLYELGLGVKRDPDEAAEWRRRAGPPAP
jgi:TPR repeat protein